VRRGGGEEERRRGGGVEEVCVDARVRGRAGARVRGRRTGAAELVYRTWERWRS